MRTVHQLHVGDGWRFGISTRPDRGHVGGVALFVPPFAEELNRCRRQVASAARAFAQHGWAAVQFDLLGTGDSSGDFGDATWASWKDDLSIGVEWCRSEFGPDTPVVLWSLRAGCLLVADWLEDGGERLPLLIWQPVIQGRQVLGTFLRLMAAARMLDGEEARNHSEEARRDLREGCHVEVAGYRLSSSIARGLEESVLELPPDFPGPVRVVEVATANGPTPATARTVGRWVDAGIAAEVTAVEGPRFWQTQEIETAPSMLDPSLAFLCGLSDARP